MGLGDLRVGHGMRRDAVRMADGIADPQQAQAMMRIHVPAARAWQTTPQALLAQALRKALDQPGLLAVSTTHRKGHRCAVEWHGGYSRPRYYRLPQEVNRWIWMHQARESYLDPVPAIDFVLPEAEEE